ncbi:hypothetical protein MTR_7g097240 [Medicago truncatula]|uniref:Uncharacterized protein n=1 Tax=Medicago truncatula TaxID=3880 RepID=A0A072UDR7_MEDTR|nr:hypothetical protein MTR_7g097240 [Medicago truncatula]
MLAAVSEITNKLKAKTFTIVAWEWECPVKCAGTNSGIQEPLFPDRTCTNSGTTSNVSPRKCCKNCEMEKGRSKKLDESYKQQKDFPTDSPKKCYKLLPLIINAACQMS